MVGLALGLLPIFVLAVGWSVWALVHAGLTTDAGAFTLNPLIRLVQHNYLLWQPLWHSVILGVIVATAATLIGGGLAYLAVRTDLPGREMILPLVALPHIIPGFQLASAWVLLFSFNGLWQSVTGWQAPVPAYGVVPMMIVLVLHLTLFPFLLIAASLNNLDPALEEAGRIAGLSFGRVLRRITLPLTLPAMTASLLLVFAYVLEEFGIPSLLGTPQGYDTLTTRIYGLATTTPLDLSAAAWLALVLGGIALLVLRAQNRLVGSGGMVGNAKISRPSVQPLGSGRWPVAWFVFFILGLVAFLPILTLLLTSVLESWGRGFGFANWTLARYQDLWLRPELRTAFVNTVFLALTSAAIILLLALVIAYGAYRLRWRMSRLADQLGFVTLALPGLVIGLALILGFVGGWLPLYGTLGILVLAFVLRFSGIAVRNLMVGMGQIGLELEAAAALSGLSRLRVLARVVVPLLAPSLLSSAILVVINTVKEISATSLLVGQGTQTLAFEAYIRFQEGSFTTGSAISVVMIATVLLLLGLGRVLSQPKGVFK